MNKQKIIFILAITVFIITVLLSFVMVRLVKENNECINNPFIYGAKVIEEQGMPVICRCDSLDPKYIGFTYDKNGIRIKDELKTDYFYNISLLNYNEDEGEEGVPQ